MKKTELTPDYVKVACACQHSIRFTGIGSFCSHAHTNKKGHARTQIFIIGAHLRLVSVGLSKISNNLEFLPEAVNYCDFFCL